MAECKNPAYKGCNRKCPCRQWINCRYYDWYKKKKYYQLERWRSYMKNKYIHQYYDEYFRTQYDVQGEMQNG